MKLWIVDNGNWEHKKVLLEVVRERIPVEECAEGLKIVLVMDEAVGPKESYRIDEEAGIFTVTGADKLGLYFGIGKLLHTAAWTDKALAPKATDGIISPDCPSRTVYFATHFFNFYNLAPIEVLAKYCRDLVLWGYNSAYCTMSVAIYDSMEEPKVVALFKKIRQIFTIANNYGMRCCIGAPSNQGLNSAPKEFYADTSCYDRRCKVTGRNICPEIPGALDYLLDVWRQRLEKVKDLPIHGVSWGPYDEGGCGCPKCRPWGANGYPKLSKSLNKLVKEYFPNASIGLSTWFFDQPDDEGEYEGLYARIESGELDFVDRLTSDSHHGYPKYPLTHKPPRPTTGFPEISMHGLRPWGGRGANPLLRRFQSQWEVCKDVIMGGTPYTESIYEDISKIQYISYYWDKNRHYTDTLREYCNYEFQAEFYDEILEMCHLIEDNHMGVFEGREPDMQKAYRVEELAESVNSRMYDHIKNGWRWRLLYIRAKIDRMVYEYYYSKGKDYYLVNDTGRRWADSDGTMVEPGEMISALGALWRTPVSYLADNQEAQELMWELVGYYHNDLEKGTGSVMCPPLVINEETKRAHGYL